MKYDVVIIGAGPGGLHCGRVLAENGVRTLILERKKQIGPKICAGGITWRGLIRTIPEPLVERTFSRQVITTRYQKTVIEEPFPMVATVNRMALGSYMAEQAAASGAEIIPGAWVETTESNRLIYRYNGAKYSVLFDFLVGADGANSLVRRYLGIDGDSVEKGVGINYTVADAGQDMIWNFDSGLFPGGYSWIFPHKYSASAGAYVGTSSCSTQQLKKGLDNWLGTHHVDTSGCRLEAEKINWDYRGWNFKPFFLVGDAAGLASPLTGEGINPAFVSGETVAQVIINPSAQSDQLNRIIERHRSHRKILKTACTSRLLSTVLSEICAVLLRYRLINFKRFEMA